MRLRDKVVLITGASEGIGAACAAAFRAQGARLALAARSRDKLERVAGSDALAVAGDLLEPPVRRRLVEATLDRFGRIDVLVNNAGVGLYAPPWKAPMPLVRDLFELNLFAALELIQLAVPHMKAQRGGAIVNISSIVGRVTVPWFTLYSASKFALCSLTDGLRMELGQYGIHCMAVCPGYVETNFQRHVLAGAAPERLRRVRRFTITASQCAQAVVRGLEREARTVVTPRIGWLLIAAHALFPGLLERRFEQVYRGLDMT